MDLLETIVTILLSLLSGSVGALFAILIEGYRAKLSIISRIRETQFTLYNDLWSSLYDLKLSGDKLWSNVSKINLEEFEKQLKETELKINRSSLAIEENDMANLLEIINVFWNFRIGKGELFRLKQLQQKAINYRQIDLAVLEETLQRNRQTKDRYDNLILNIQKTLRKQLRTV